MYSDWLIDNKIVERIHGRPGESSVHPELLKHSHVMFIFLALQRRLTIDHAETLWEGAMDKHSSRYVFLLLSEISRYLEENIVSCPYLSQLRPLLYSFNIYFSYLTLYR